MQEPEKRVSGKVVDIDYGATRRFFDQRADRPADDCSWTRVMYQDGNPQLVVARDEHEKQVVLPKLRLQETHRLLDVGCGVGRWAHAVAPIVRRYLGTDFSDGLLDRARESLRGYDNVEFQCVPAQEVGTISGTSEPFNRVIVAGVLAYLNDDDVRRCLRGIAEVCSSTDATVYIREPMGVEARLTLDKFWSEQLGSEYSAIYRSREEYQQLLASTLCTEGFRIGEFTNLYPEDLQNRVETSQFIVLLHRDGAA